jgi:hypothetical protein
MCRLPVQFGVKSEISREKVLNLEQRVETLVGHPSRLLRGQSHEAREDDLVWSLGIAGRRNHRRTKKRNRVIARNLKVQTHKAPSQSFRASGCPGSCSGEPGRNLLVFILNPRRLNWCVLLLLGDQHQFLSGKPGRLGCLSRRFPSNLPYPRLGQPHPDKLLLRTAHQFS